MLPMPPMDGSGSRSGFCAIVGLPNVGKSTLLNRVLGRRLVAVSSKPQTTRDRIVGVHTIALPLTDGAGATELGRCAQIAYVDTPGWQDGQGPLRRYMRDAAIAAAGDADVVLMLIDVTDRRGRQPERVAEDAAGLRDAARAHPMVIALNKVDRIAKPELLPLIEAWTRIAADVVPISAVTGDNLDVLERIIAGHLPEAPPMFPDGMVTDRSPQFIAQEIIREQLYHQLGKELPYASAVQVESFEERSNELVIKAVIVVERDSQKSIVVGRAGARIKELGIASRAALAESFGKPVHLATLVKVRQRWTSAESELRKLGYGGNAR